MGTEDGLCNLHAVVPGNLVWRVLSRSELRQRRAHRSRSLVLGSHRVPTRAIIEAWGTSMNPTTTARTANSQASRSSSTNGALLLPRLNRYETRNARHNGDGDGEAHDHPRRNTPSVNYPHSSALAGPQADARAIQAG